MKKFTLMELLVIVTIMAILISILMPALDKARYKTQMAVCMSNLSQINKINTGYALDNNRKYLTREAAQSSNFGAPYTISHSSGDNDRQKFIELNLDNILCPLTGSKQDLTVTGKVNILFSYSMYYGWSAGKDGTTKLFSQLGVFDYKGTEFNIGASDILHIIRNKNRVTNSHSGYYASGARRVEPESSFSQDSNFLRLDGSVYTEYEVKSVDSRFIKVPYEINSQSAVSTNFLYLPKEMK